MAINLATKFSDKIATVFTHGSYVKRWTNSEYNWTGVKTLQIATPQTVPMAAYKRSGTNRYGEPQEMQDTLQELTLTVDEGFSLTVDKGNNTEQMGIKNAGKMLRLQLDEQAIPNVDKRVFAVVAQQAGKVAGITKPTKSTIVDAVAVAGEYLDENITPEEGRVLFVTPEMYRLIKGSSEFISIGELGKKSVGKGEVGELDGNTVIKVPSRYFPTGVYFALWYKKAVLEPTKLHDTHLHMDPPGISGHLIEGRNIYDAFVLGVLADSVYVAVDSSKKLGAVTITKSSGAIECSGASKILYTTDGTDPRYSSTAQVYTAALGAISGKTVKAVGYAEDKFPSDVAELVA
ncbi:Uncharacterised protein [Anaerotruncus sp. 2789STDY5834896]|uniref:Uncharacterized protein n=1 Tax=uncultured Anaerotruncus sp. TaxID=905011 RepID=A0A1C6FQ99_9FIRM|nr:Uncharacterised protein [uncultured Anaerotruncus sp.]